MESIFTNLYEKNQLYLTNPIKRTEALRSKFLDVMRELNIKSIIDCGCGNFQWMKEVDLTGIQYTGLDIVKSIIEINQRNYTKDNIHFAVSNVCVDPPFDGDLWLARDLLCLWSVTDFVEFIKQFLESSSLYLAITSIDTDGINTDDGLVGIWKRWNMLKDPFSLPKPFIELGDGQQWFCAKKMLVYSREQIEEWFEEFEARYLNKSVENPLERNAHLKGNITLRDYQISL